MRTLAAFAALLLTLCGSGANALTLDEAVGLALENNHGIKQIGYLADSAREKVGAARAGFLPSLDIGYTYMETGEEITPGINTSSNFSVTATYNLFSGMSDLKGLKGAKAGAEAAVYQSRSATADLIFSVKTAYINVLKTKRLVETASESVELLERQAAEAKLFYSEGLIARNDLLRVEVELASARLELLQAKGNHRIALKALDRTLGVGVAADEEIVDFEGLPEMPALTAEAMMEEMLNIRSELMYLKALRASRRYSLGAIRGGYLPRVDLVMSFEQSGNDEWPYSSDNSTDDTRAVVSATWNLFDGLRTHHLKNEAAYLVRSVEEEILDTEKALAFQLNEALETYAVSKGKLNLATKAVSQAEENYRVTESRFHERAATTTDLINARSFLTRTRNQKNNALYDMHMAVSRIERVLELPRAGM
jgi:outer membrane protein TolC